MPSTCVAVFRVENGSTGDGILTPRMVGVGDDACSTTPSPPSGSDEVGSSGMVVIVQVMCLGLKVNFRTLDASPSRVLMKWFWLAMSDAIEVGDRMRTVLYECG